jgi:hypothetical protein
MFKLIKPQEILTSLFLFTLIVGYLIEEKYPSLALVLVGCLVGLVVGGIWTNTTNKWLLINGNNSTNSTHINIDGEYVARKNIFYVWFIFKSIYIAFLLLGAYSAFYLLLLFINYTSEYSWYIKVLFALACGLLTTLVSIAPLLVFEFLEKKIKNRFVLKYKKIFKQIDSIK